GLASPYQQTFVPLTINLEMVAEYRQLTGDSLENMKDGCGAVYRGGGNNEGRHTCRTQCTYLTAGGSRTTSSPKYFANGHV
ncbi:MAG: hypothetical protein WCB69_04265, partial [Pseudolabrys sp.]